MEYADFEPMINTQDPGEEDNRPLEDSSRNRSVEFPAANSAGVGFLGSLKPFPSNNSLLWIKFYSYLHVI